MLGERNTGGVAPGEGPGPRFSQGDGAALALDIDRVAIDLVQEQVAHRHRGVQSEVRLTPGEVDGGGIRRWTNGRR